MKIRKTKPEANNKYYITKSKGGWSNAIVGNPTDKDCNVLSNCVGYAYGRFNEIGGYGYCKYLAPVNAELFMNYKGSLKTGQVAKQGAVMVWQKGTTSGSDGAGHVAIVEEVRSATEVFTSESDWGGKAFYNSVRKKGNGNWGLPTGYKFLGFIYNPAVKEEPKKTNAEIVKEVIAGKWGNGADRKTNLTNAGYNYDTTQKLVNEAVKPKPTPKPVDPKPDILHLTKMTIRGDFGNGVKRKLKLGKHYQEVQYQVNKNLNAGNTQWDKIKLYK